MSPAVKLVVWPASIAVLTAIGCETPGRLESQTPFELGRDAARIKDYATAIAQLTVAINNARDRVFTEAHLERGECYLRKATSLTEDPAEREQSLQSAFDDASVVLKELDLPAAEQARAFTLQGKTLIEKRDPAGAQQAFERVLELRLDRQDWGFLLAAHRELGRILLERALAARKTEQTAVEELRNQEEFRSAQHHFSRGLEIDVEDEECNLGKGICLHYRGQDRDAIKYLDLNTELSDAKGTLNDPRGHFHLGLALELQKGYQEKALEHFKRSAEQDSRQAYTPLYAHLVRVLLVYVPFEDPQFGWFFDKMLAYSGEDLDYWTSLERFGDHLAGGTEARKEAGLFARAVARARIAKIDAAVADALALKASPGFLQMLARIFPLQPKRAEFLYGRALALFGAKRHEDLASFFEGASFRFPEPGLLENEHFQKALMIEGKNIVASWLARDLSRTVLTDQQKTERDNYLARAIAAFQGYLSRHPDDREVTLAMGEAQELTDEYYKASQSYARIAKANPGDAEAFRRLARLHDGKVLNAQQATEAWVALLGYSGDDLLILEYVNRTGVALRSQALLYCTGCGRKGTEGDVLCQECGRQIGSTATEDE